MTPGAAKQSERQAWKPHPDDDADVAAAVQGAERGNLLSPEASDTFLCWLEGSDDDSWRVEFE